LTGNPTLSLTGRIAVVTGAGKGIGKGIAIAFAQAGADVVLCDRVEDSNLGEVAEIIRRLGRRALAIQADTSVKDEVDRFIRQAVDQFGSIDLLVNNAGIIRKGPILDFGETDWDALMNTNLKGYYLCGQAAGKIMAKQKRGSIINIASHHAFKATLNFGAYCIAKAGVVMLTRVLARELGPYHIRANCIAPGLVKTDFSKDSWSNPDFLKAREDSLPLGRVAEVDDIIGAALFLASDASHYVTAQTLIMSGGDL
jgi:NAD(P)-dependent dehydrogenase (short-subunit alcohol dehydrogenase family)